MPVGYKKETIIFFLHTHVIAHSTKIITQVQKAGWPDTADNNFFHKSDEDKKTKRELKNLDSRLNEPEKQILKEY